VKNPAPGTSGTAASTNSKGCQTAGPSSRWSARWSARTPGARGAATSRSRTKVVGSGRRPRLPSPVPIERGVELADGPARRLHDPPGVVPPPHRRRASPLLRVRTASVCERPPSHAARSSAALAQKQQSTATPSRRFDYCAHSSGGAQTREHWDAGNSQLPRPSPAARSDGIAEIGVLHECDAEPSAPRRG
jgi:hypothetical protein